MTVNDAVLTDCHCAFTVGKACWGGTTSAAREVVRDN